MSEATTGPGFDPRYDPRYQRGWVDGVTDAAGAAPDGAPVPVPAVPAGPGVTSAVAPSPTGADPLAQRSEGPSPAGGLGSGQAPARPAPSSGPADHGPAHDPSDADDADDADDPAARVMRIALGIAWAIAIGSFIVGAGLVWSLVARAPAYSAPTDAAELIVLGLAQYAAPSMLTTGALAVVVLTVLDGFRRARNPAQRTAGGGGRRS